VRTRAPWFVVAVAATVATTTLIAPPASAAPMAAPSQSPGPAPSDVSAEAAGARAEARRTGRRVEVVSGGTEYELVYANPDGSYTSELYAYPQRVRRGAGWVPVDTTLAAGADGRIAPVASTADVRLSGGGSGGGSAPLVTLSRGNHRIGLSWPGALPAPVLAGDTATYPEVLPGVDLKVHVDVSGYRQVLVVKNPAAAASLRQIRFGLVADGVTARVTPDGGIVATDRAGQPVFAADPAIMWDSPETAPAGRSADAIADAATAGDSPSPRRIARMPVRLAGGTLTVVPDQRLLTDPGANYPITIDPGQTNVGSFDWTHINENFPAQSYWNYDRAEGAKVGFSNWSSPTVKYRSFFLFSFAGWQGRQITGATFHAELDHSASCSNTPTDLYRTADISRSQPITWNNSAGGGTWHTWLAQASGKANGSSCGQGNMTMEWGNVLGVVQAAANGGAQLTLGLRAPNEGDRNQWKKFVPTNVGIATTWNAAPNPPGPLSTVPPTPCGTGTNPTSLNTPTPVFSARLSDPHNDNVFATLQVKENNALVHQVDTSTVVSGSVVSWPAIPAGTLPTGAPTRVFSYEAQTSDGSLGSTSTAKCYFTVDTVIPGTPTVESDDFPDGEPLLAVGQVGTLRLRPGFDQFGLPDGDIGGYRYGFQQDKLTGWVAADATGTATIPMVLWTTARTLYVQAVDRAGNPSISEEPCICTRWDLRATASGATPARTVNDVNGDGRADVSTVVDLGYGRTAAWTLIGKATGGFHQPYLGWDTGINGGFDGYRTKHVTGDFTGDGLSDVAVFRDDPDNRLRLFLLRSDSHRYDADATPLWESSAGSVWRLNAIQPGVVDMTGDGKPDIVAVLTHGPAEFSVQVFPTVGSGSTVDFGNPVEWWHNPAGWAEPRRMKMVLGDFNGDGRNDFGHFYNYDNSHTRLWVHYSTGTTLGSGTEVWNGGVNNWDWNRATHVAGDFTGDNLVDIMGIYDYDSHSRMWLWQGTATGFTVGTIWWDGASAGTGFLGTRASYTVGDFNADDRPDIAALYEPSAATAKVHLFLTNSTGTGAVPPTISAPAWSGPIGAVPANVNPEPGRYYRLVASHSGKCIDVPAWSTANAVQLQQYTCLEPGTNQRVTFVPVGGGPYYMVKFFHSGKCLDVAAYSRDYAGAIHQYDCLGNGNQQFRLEYLTGSGLDVQARVRAAHSDLCLAVSGASLSDTATAVQWGCTGGPGTDHSYYIRLTP